MCMNFIALENKISELVFLISKLNEDKLLILAKALPVLIYRCHLVWCFVIYCNDIQWPHYAPVVYVVINLSLAVSAMLYVINLPKYLIWYATNQRWVEGSVQKIRSVSARRTRPFIQSWTWEAATLVTLYQRLFFYSTIKFNSGCAD